MSINLHIKEYFEAVEKIENDHAVLVLMAKQMCEQIGNDFDEMYNFFHDAYLKEKCEEPSRQIHADSGATDKSH